MSSLVVLNGTAWQQLNDALAALHQAVSQGSMEQSTVVQMVEQLESVAQQAVCEEPHVVVVRTDHLDWVQIVEDAQAARVVLQRIATIEETITGFRPEATANSTLPPWTATAADLWEDEDAEIFVGTVVTDSAQLVPTVCEQGTFNLPQEVRRPDANEQVRRTVELADEMMRESKQAAPPIGTSVETNHGDTCEIAAVEGWVAGYGWAVRVSSESREHESAFALRDRTRWVVRFPIF